MEELPPQPLDPSPELDLDTLKSIKILGKGAMGTVFLVKNNSNSAPFALKVVDKLLLNTKLDADRRARWEVKVLTLLSRHPHPFLPSLLATFDCHDYMGWAVPYCPGGDLNVLRHRQNDGVFSPAVLRFYLAEIICALEHLHNLGIAYRDLKPENVLIQQSGHVTLTDFDLSRSLDHPAVRTAVKDSVLPPRAHRKINVNLTRWMKRANLDNKNKNLKINSNKARVIPLSREKNGTKKLNTQIMCESNNGERSNSFVGTEEYVAPEIVRGEGHEFAVDWWALGVLTYECLFGATPFKGRCRKETFRNVVTKTPELLAAGNNNNNKNRTAVMDLIGRLLEKDPRRRLGYVGGACEVKEHEFFRGVRWDLLTEVARAPFIPEREEDIDVNERRRETENCGESVREYFEKLRAPPPPLSPDYQFAEF